MDKDELSAFVINELSEGTNTDDLILKVCQETICTWPEAEAFVRRIREEYGPRITRKQFPMLFVLALSIFLCGLGLVIFSVYSTWYCSSTIGNAIGCLVTMVYNGSAPIFAFIAGIAMMLGSLLGMRDIWSKILE